MDKDQIREFLEILVGWRTVGVAGEEEIVIPRCRDMRTFLTGVLGESVPKNAFEAQHGHSLHRPIFSGPALAALLRQVADACAPEYAVAVLSEARNRGATDDLAAACREMCRHYKDFLDFIQPTDLAIGRDNRAQENALEAAIAALANYEMAAA